MREVALALKINTVRLAYRELEWMAWRSNTDYGKNRYNPVRSASRANALHGWTPYQSTSKDYFSSHVTCATATILPTNGGLD